VIVFTNIVGSAHPVLADIEKTIEQYGMTRRALEDQPDDIRQAIERLRQEPRDAAAAPVKADDLGNADALSIPEAVRDAETPMRDLAARLTTNPLTAPLFTDLEDGTWLLNLAGKPARTSFDGETSPLKPEDLQEEGESVSHSTAPARIPEHLTSLLTFRTPIVATLLPTWSQ
jgi:hypothetical protein